MLSTLLALLSLPLALAAPKVLVFSATEGYRHDSIETAVKVLAEQGPPRNVSFSFTEDGRWFNTDELFKYDGLLFVSTTGEGVLDGYQQEALQKYLQSGGNFVGVHAATEALKNNDWFRDTIGGRFSFHPEYQPATFLALNNSWTHPSMENVPDSWRFGEEVYNFENNPRDIQGLQVIMTVNESSYDAGEVGVSPSQGTPHPIAWYQDHIAGAQPTVEGGPGAGRSFYTSLGHADETWRDPTFLGHLFGGLKWAIASGTTKAYNTNAIVGDSTPGDTTGPVPTYKNETDANATSTTNVTSTTNGTSTDNTTATTTGGDSTDASQKKKGDDDNAALNLDSGIHLAAVIGASMVSGSLVLLS